MQLQVILDETEYLELKKDKETVKFATQVMEIVDVCLAKEGNGFTESDAYQYFSQIVQTRLDYHKTEGSIAQCPLH